MKEIIVSDKAPAAVGTYSVATKAGNTVYCSGQLGLDPASGTLPASFEAQCRQALKNVFAVLEAAGAEEKDIVRLMIFVKDLNDFPTLNAIMEEVFTTPFPARSCVQAAALPKGGLVEIEATAVIG